MRSFLAAFTLSFILIGTTFPLLHAEAASNPINRKDAFLLLWHSALRTSSVTKEKPFSDVQAGDTGFQEITYAKARGIIGDNDTAFHPTMPVDFSLAMLWLFRTRNAEPIRPGVKPTANQLVQTADLPDLLNHYDMATPENGTTMTEETLMNYMQLLDGKLAQEPHEVSLYSEKFHGQGTAFGETFDMNAMTAAHRSFPHNTLVKVTNLQNNKSVTVRINDRGPFVAGRDMDLSLGAFTTIADRSSGKINATFQRLGDATLVNVCGDAVLQRRVTRSVILDPGIPKTLALGKTLSVKANHFFVYRGVTYPDGNHTDAEDWIGPEESFTFTPSIVGNYSFFLRDKDGNKRTMTMEVKDCDEVSM